MNPTINFAFAFILLIACDGSQSRKIKRYGEFAEGNISIGKDTVFNGLIRFYDTSDYRLTSEAYYKHDSLHGERIDYHPNGKIASLLNYTMDEANGLASFFDTSGILHQSSHFFHGLQAGPLINYYKNEPRTYSFYTFDGRRILQLDYDSAIEQSIKSLKGKLFFYAENYFIESYDPTNVETRFFIYLPNPPLMNFSYSICVIDSSDKIVETLKNFSDDKFWTEYAVNSKSKKSSEKFALKLSVKTGGKEILSDTLNLE